MTTHPRTRQLIIGFAMDGSMPTEIRRKLADCGKVVCVSTIRNVLREARAAGRLLPATKPGPLPIVPEDIAGLLRPHAEVRRIAVRELARVIVCTVAQHGMVDAVLDDGVAP